MQENHVNMQDTDFDIQGTYAFSKLPVFFKICLIWEILFTCQNTQTMQHTYVGMQQCHIKIRISYVNMQLSHFKI